METRIDFEMVKRGLCSGRDRAKELIKKGAVLLNGKVCTKPSVSVLESDIIKITDNDCPYVSRGGLKLEKALNVFKIDVKGLVCLDIGASTGGFSDCLIQNGAKKVYALDNGHNQLSEKLKSNEKIVNLENINFRYATQDDLKETFDFVCCDVSFISLKHILNNLNQFLKPDATAVMLIKPQFEAGKENIGKNGVVKDRQIQYNIIEKTINCAEENRLSAMGLDFSPITGQNGNIEFLLYLKKEKDIINFNKNIITETVLNAHNNLK